MGLTKYVFRPRFTVFMNDAVDEPAAPAAEMEWGDSFDSTWRWNEETCEWDEVDPISGVQTPRYQDVIEIVSRWAFVDGLLLQGEFNPIDKEQVTAVIKHLSKLVNDG